MNSLTRCAVWLLSAGFAAATTVWNPAANGISPPATGNWNTAANWTNGIPGFVAPGEKTVFNLATAADCLVTDAQSFNQLVQGDNGNAGAIRIKNGGSLTTGSTTWSAVGYNRNSQMFVESGGVANFNNTLYVGYLSPALATLNIDGGIVNVAGQIGLGWSTGTGFVNITNGGVLNLTGLDATQSIKGASTLDIRVGSVVIDGDKSTMVQNYITAGKITGYGGTGMAIYDYNVTNLGKTTIKALVTPIVANWHVATTVHPSDVRIVTPFTAAEFGIVADGVTDVTTEIQTALTLIKNIGGGALYLPAGRYKVSGGLNVPTGVTLRGDWLKPEMGTPLGGTILQAYAGRGSETGAPFIQLNTGSGVNGIAIWYPEQLPTSIQPYPPTISGGASTLENVTFVNSYFGFTTFRQGTTALPFLRNIYGTPLKTGIEWDCLADIGRIETVHFSPACWKNSGLPDAPTANQHAAWIYNNGTGMIVRRIDWSFSCYVTVEGYNIGLALRPGRYDSKDPNGQSYDFNLLGCKTGIHIEDSSYAGYQFTRFNIQQAETGVYLGPAASETVMFHSCTINASRDAIFNDGTATARVLMVSCTIQQGPIRLEHGCLSIINSDFTSNSSTHIELGSDTRGASIQGNRFTGGPRIVARTLYPVWIDHSPVAADPLPAYNYKKPASPYQPSKPDLFVVTKAPYNAQADGVTDDTAAFQTALTSAAANGGGTVFVPGGNYRINGSLIVPTGVELRGIFDTPHGLSVKGSLLNVYAGRNDANGTPFIQLQAGAGIRGLTFHYPEQIYDVLDTVNYGMVPYPFIIRGLGADVYAINLSATIPYQLLDLATHRCDRHYIDYVLGTALKTGFHVGNGAVGGQLQNCQLNPSTYTQQGGNYPGIPFNTSSNIHQILWRDATPYLFGHMTGEVLHQNFVFGGARGFHMVKEGSFGPSGYSLGMGVDQCTTAMKIDDVGSGGLGLINSQIVTVNGTSGRYLETDALLEDTFRMFSCAGWGTHQHSALISGGNVKLQLFHLAPDAEAGVFRVFNNASLQNIGGNLDDPLTTGRSFITIDPTASAAFIGNIINASQAQMPVSAANVTNRGNLRLGALAAGADRFWTNGGGGQTWNNPANWSGGVVPGSADRATLANNSVAGPIISAGITASVKNLVVGDLSNPTDRLGIIGGSLASAEWLILGNGPTNAGTLVMSSGAVNIGSDLFVGFRGAGTLNLTDGAISVAGRLGIAQHSGSTGNVSLAGGTLSADSLYMTSGALMDIAGGTLIINGDSTAIISSYFNNTWITAHGGAGIFTVDYDNRYPGKTTLTATNPNEASVDLGAIDTITSLSRVPNSGDGNTTVETVGGKICRANTTPATDRYMYFNVDNLFAYQLASGSVTIEVEYYDANTSTVLGLQYDSTTSAYKTHPQTITTTGSNTWRTASFQITDAFFGGRQNNSADFRLNFHGKKLNVNRVLVRLLVEPYAAWAGAAAFNTDANNDGVANGLAWLLGSSNPSANASALLPMPTHEVGKLVLTFRCLKTANRGEAVLKVQYTNDLGLADPWANHEAVVPDADSTVGSVVFDTTTDADPAFVKVRAEIPSNTALPAGKVFGRLHSTGN